MPGFFVEVCMFAEELVAKLNKIARERATIRASLIAEPVKAKLLADLEAAEKALGASVDLGGVPTTEAPAGGAVKAGKA